MTKPFGGLQLTEDAPVSIPREFFLDVLPQISEIAEAQVTLCVFRIASELGGLAKPIPERRIVRDRSVRQALRVSGSPNEPDRRIGVGLDLAVGRSTLLKLVASHGNDERIWYYVNTLPNQSRVQAIIRGTEPPPVDMWHDGHVPTVAAERPTVFRLYEQNIGILTPIMAEKLVDAIETYPGDWIEDAIAEAVTYNRRSWRYVDRILQNWALSGRGRADFEGR